MQRIALCGTSGADQAEAANVYFPSMSNWPDSIWSQWVAIHWLQKC